MTNGLLWAAILLAYGCGGSSHRTTVDAGGDGGVFSCGGDIDSPPYEGNTHVPVGTKVNYMANPPASGDHYYSPPNGPVPWQVYTNEIPPEEWVHNLEHGGIVLLYNCPNGCDSDVNALTALRNGTHPDQYNEQRIVITPDTAMPKKFAAVAWLYRWQGDAVDETQIRCFIDARYDKAPESIP